MKKPSHKKLTKKQKTIIILSVCFILAVAISVTFFILFRKSKAEPVAEDIPAPAPEKKYYSRLSGEEIKPGEDDTPIYCIQVPNGLDGARPQVGLHQAKVVFEAIAEAGITRFAAVFQNPTGSAIGPIRSLRSYYLDWDTPLDCTIVHAGGSDDAIAALRSGGYLEIDESEYTWRNYSDFIAPNNLFTSPSLLAAHSTAVNYTTAKYTAWPRLTPEESLTAAQAVNPTTEDTTDANTEPDTNTESTSDTTKPTPVSTIRINYGGYADFNPVYQYNPDTNTYLRSYASGTPHNAYACPDGLSDPVFSRDCTLSQLAPSAVAVIKVSEWLDTDGYHHVIKTIGSGEAYIFQNHTVIPATWKKLNQSDQISFTTQDGTEVKLAPGQLWITAIPTTGTVTYE